jgi:predicted transcriptional regulator of viral defense system
MRHTNRDKAVAIFSKRGGVLRTSQATKLGINPATLQKLHADGRLVYVTRGIHRLASLPGLKDPDLSTVAARLPDAVICLISALSFHNLGTQIPHEVYIALPRGGKPARLDHPPLRTFWLSGSAYTDGIETHDIDGFKVKVYCPEKTVADCFKFRNKVGLDVALEALRSYLEGKHPDRNKLIHFADVCRVSRIMMPYLEAIQ